MTTTNNMTTAETITDDQIRALRDEAGAVGDELQVMLCTVALGHAYAVKYADPTEGARLVEDESDLRAIERQDPSLLVDEAKARAKCARAIADAEAMRD